MAHGEKNGRACIKSQDAAKFSRKIEIEKLIKVTAPRECRPKPMSTGTSSDREAL